MTQPNPLKPIPSPQTYLSLKVGKAIKTGSRSHGYLHYRILTDTAQQQLFITLIGNDGDGCYSKEIVPFDTIEQCLHDIDTSKPIASKRFQPAFIGKSANNAGFLAAVLRAELLLAPAPDVVHQHTVQPDWPAWKNALLALAQKAEPYQPEQPKPRNRSATPVQDNPHENPQPITETTQSESPIPSAGTEYGTGHLDDSLRADDAYPDGPGAERGDDEGECLQRGTLDADRIDLLEENDVDQLDTTAAEKNTPPAKKQGRDKRAPHGASEKRP
jgi:hypothetical protein